MNSPQALYHAVERLARRNPRGRALVHRGGCITYAQLWAETEACVRGLWKAGIRPGMRTVVMVRPGPEFLVVVYALIRLGAVMVMVDPGMGWANLGSCLAEARPRAFIGIPLAQAASLLFGWGRPTVRLRVTVGRPRLWSGFSYRGLLSMGASETVPLPPEPEMETPAALVFTSGSTGVPKGVVYTQKMFAAQARLMRDHFGIEAGEVDLATFPLFAFFDPVWRTTTVFPQMDFSRPGKADPRRIIGAIQEHRVTHMFGSPALLERVVEYAEGRRVSLPSLRRVLSAGAPVPLRLIERFRRLLAPEAELFTPYGATEALPVCSVGSRELLEEDGTARGLGVCIGRPIEGVGLALIRVTDEQIAEWSEDLQVEEGQVGEIVVWGDNVSASYFARPEANRLAKIAAPQGEIRHRMGDLGRRDEKGRIWFCGRKSQRVRTEGGTLFTVCCEGVFNQHPAVRRTALVGIGEAPRQRPVLCVELLPAKRKSDRDRLRREILDLGKSFAQTRPIDTILFHPRFPVDVRHNAKIFREKLAVWAARKIS